mmetsp:Transcript_15061/g.23452  ORF Transcript_15061/g.23452 Transcript_15061/m.23452 type:complete len:529 (+) Transcript_15061:305-1891(+)|eukprot:CAMPEP_0195300292 /NCGR_PEP_ID=MMETSP0707-20130614/27141_1 /TAXON_ID=33640 /ORGANISM="Asterionellopsis glacialis, Strain CCMP134" /LENGTH=528 /DNA_ID=CAMNT_0040362949 /DNA_START=283 /DNA_END=1869 /DNA_ORIENTATION=-
MRPNRNNSSENSAIAGHSTLRRRHSILRSRLSMKSNPYIGSFRHAPPVVGQRARSLVAHRNYNNAGIQGRASYATVYAPSSLHMKSSPYIGWFRHAPPTRLASGQMGSEKKQEIAAILNTITKNIDASSHKIKYSRYFPAKDGHFLRPLVDGRLLGGSPTSTLGNVDDLFPPITWLDRNVSATLRKGLKEKSIVSSSATVKVLTKLASWLLLPGDRDICYYPTESSDENDLKKEVDSPITALHRMLSEDSNEYLRESDDDSSSTSSYSSSSREEGELSSISDNNEDLSSAISEISDDLGTSISSLAEAYYAHQATSERNEGTRTTTSLQSGDPYVFYGEGHHRLDYVITQMDIARMARTASRHLDVESILNLPTITYRAASPPLQPPPPPTPEHERTEEEGWSWMMVPGSSDVSRSPSSSFVSPQKQSPLNKKKGEEQNVCVICLEHFVDGDRLRVLPCNHLFHMGCIDRWLSGSHSDHDCFTSGCPTCKKRPELLEPPSPDGSVPSWSFSRVGDALARDSFCLDTSK